MDNTIQLKINLISRIKDSTDLNFLKALQTIFDSSDQALFTLNKQQKESIRQGRNDIANGSFKNHKDVISEMEQWLRSE